MTSVYQNISNDLRLAMMYDKARMAKTSNKDISDLENKMNSKALELQKHIDRLEQELKSSQNKQVLNDPGVTTRMDNIQRELLEIKRENASGKKNKIRIEEITQELKKLTEGSSPGTSELEERISVQMRKLNDEMIQLNGSIDTGELEGRINLQISKLNDEMSQLDDKLKDNVHVSVDTSELEGRINLQISKLNDEMSQLGDKIKDNVPVTVDTSELEGRIKQLEDDVENVNNIKSDPQLIQRVDDIENRTEEVQKKFDEIEKDIITTMKFNTDTLPTWDSIHKKDKKQLEKSSILTEDTDTMMKSMYTRYHEAFVGGLLSKIGSITRSKAKGIYWDKHAFNIMNRFFQRAVFLMTIGPEKMISSPSLFYSLDINDSFMTTDEKLYLREMYNKYTNNNIGGEIDDFIRPRIIYCIIMINTVRHENDRSHKIADVE